MVKFYYISNVVHHFQHINLGLDYEKLGLAHCGIVCSKDVNIKNFQIVFNAKNHENLDDLVIDEVFLNNTRSLTCWQIKHKLDGQNLAFNFKKHLKAYDELKKNKYQDIEIKVILFTNAKTVGYTDISIVSIEKQLVEVTDQNLIKFNTGNGKVYQFKNNTEPFYKNFYVFLNQMSMEQNDNLLSADLDKTIVSHAIDNISKYFIKAVIRRTDSFKRDEFLSILTECILKPTTEIKYNIPSTMFSHVEFKILKQFKIVQIDVQFKNLALHVMNTFLKKYFSLNGDHFQHPFDELHENILNKVLNMDKINQLVVKKKKEHFLTYEDLMFLPWQIEESPLIIRYNQNYKNQVDYVMKNFLTDSNGPLILVGTEPLPTETKAMKIFHNLASVEDEALKDEYLADRKIVIKNVEFNLKEMLGGSCESLKTISPNIFFKLMNNSCNINLTTEQLDYYVGRTLTINIYSLNILETSFIFVVHDNDTNMDIETYLSDQTRYKGVKLLYSPYSMWETKNKMADVKEKYCCLYKIKNGYAVYAHNQSISELGRYEKKTVVFEEDILTNLGLINVISGDAGIGKTAFMANLERNIIRNKNIPVYLNLGVHDKELSNLKSGDEMMEYLCREFSGRSDDPETLEFVRWCIFDKYRRGNGIVVLLDGYDESKLDLDVIELLLELEIRVVITTRTHKLQPLIERFACSWFSLNTFRAVDQFDFMRRAYPGADDVQIKEALSSLNGKIDGSLMGIPLQIKHFVDIFDNIEQYTEEEENMNLLFLYVKFLDKHLRHHGKLRIRLVEQLACKLLFSPELLEDIVQIDEDDLDEFFNEFVSDNKKDFIISGFYDNMPLFVHRTYAEFLAAQYLANKKKLGKEIYDLLYENPDLTKCRHFFDLNVCKDLDLPSALLNNNLKQVRNILDNSQDEVSLKGVLQKADKFKRTTLHIAAGYGRRHDQINFKEPNKLQMNVVKEFFKVDIIKLIISKMQTVEIEVKGDKWDYNPCDYALVTRSFDILDLLYAILPNLSPDALNKAKELIFASATFDYPNIFRCLQETGSFDNIITDPNFEGNLTETKLFLNQSLVTICAMNGSKEMIKLLLDKKLFLINKKYPAGMNNSTILSTVIKNIKSPSHAQLIEELINRGAKDVFEPGENTLLHEMVFMFCYNRLLKHVPQLILNTDTPNYVDTKNRLGETPLMMALMRCEDSEFIDVLLQNDANVFEKSRNGQNLWHYLSKNDIESRNVIEIASRFSSRDDLRNMINEADHEGRTPIMEAILNCQGNIRVVNFLIENGANISVRDKRGNNIWHYLSQNMFMNDSKKIEVSKNLRFGEAPSIIDEENHAGNTPLMEALASFQGSTTFIDFLIENEATPFVKDKNGNNVWHYLSLYNVRTVPNAELLISRFGDGVRCWINEGNGRGVTPLKMALTSKRGNATLVNFLIDNGASISNLDANGGNIFHYLSKNRFIDDRRKVMLSREIIESFGEVRRMIGHVDQEGKTVLMEALDNYIHNINFINFLIENGETSIDVDGNGNNTWHYLSKNKNIPDEKKIEIAKSLMVHFGDEIHHVVNGANQKGRTPLMKALKGGDVNVAFIDLLIKSGANILSKDKRGNNLWHYLSAYGYTNDENKMQIAERLISSFGDEVLSLINETNEEGKTPLMRSLESVNKNFQFTIFLIENGADILITDNNGTNMWHYLSGSYISDENKSKVATLMLRCGDKVINIIDVSNQEGRTPLLTALISCELNKKFIEFLIEKRVNILNKDNNGNNVWHYLSKHTYAFNDNRLQIASLLLSRFGNDARNIINDANQEGETPLMEALKTSKNNIRFIDFLIKNGVNIHIKDKNGNSLWHYLSQNSVMHDENKLQIGETVIQRFAGDGQNLIDEVNQEGRTPLMEALTYCNENVFINFLIENGQNVFNKDTKGNNVWHYLGINRHIFDESKVQIGERLISRFGDKLQKVINEANHEEITPLMNALTSYDENMTFTDFLIKKDANIFAKDEIGNNTCHYLCKNIRITDERKVQITERLISYFVDVRNMIKEANQEGRTPLMEAAMSCDQSIVFIEFLTRNGANIFNKDNSGNNIWHYISKNRIMYENKVTISKTLMSRFGDEIQKLINDRNQLGRTPLMELLNNCDIVDEAIGLFIESGANILNKDNNGNNIMHYLLQNNCKSEVKMEIASKLMSQCGNEVRKMIEEANHSGRTPLMEALEKCHEDDLINFLCDNKL